MPQLKILWDPNIFTTTTAVCGLQETGVLAKVFNLLIPAVYL